MCHPEVPQKYRYVRYIIDEQKPSFGAKDADDDEDSKKSSNSKGNKHPSRLWHWAMISGYTQFYDQMSLYSNMRKRSLLPSYKLDVIGENECGVNKVNFRKMGYTMQSVLHQNFPLFLAYAIKDTFVQKKIEEKVEDLDKYILFSGNTRFQKGTKISYVIKNVLMNSFMDNGWIIGNTIEYDIREKAPGAIVSRPELMLKKGLSLNGVESNVYEFVIDFDAASQYPNLMIAFNIAKNTIHNCIFSVVANKKGADSSHEKHISGGEAFNTALQTIDTSLFDLGTTYFGLPTVTDLMKEIESVL
jgi:DNA polymerase elongation subunit (family B)